MRLKNRLQAVGFELRPIGPELLFDTSMMGEIKLSRMRA